MTWPVLRGASMKHVTIIGMGCLLAVALSWALISCSVLYRSYGSLGIRCGLLATASNPYLDGSRKLFQECSWHIGNATRSWGETHGLKLSVETFETRRRHFHCLFHDESLS